MTTPPSSNVGDDRPRALEGSTRVEGVPDSPLGTIPDLAGRTTAPETAESKPTEEGYSGAASAPPVTRSTEGWIRRHARGIEAGSALTMAVFTILLFILSIGQWQAARDSADAAKVAADAAAESNRLARDALHTAHRAWVAIKPDELPDVVAGEKPTVTLRLKNVGETPAHDAIAVLFFGLISVNTTVCDDALTVEQDAGSRGDMAPGHESTMSISTGPFSKEQIADLKSGVPAHLLYLVGRVKYDDGFGADGETRFCLFWRPETGKFVVHKAFNTMR